MSSEAIFYPLQMEELQPEIATDAFNSAALMEEGHFGGDNHGSTAEESLLHPAQPAPEDPKIKITLWRLLNTTLLLGLGVYKAVTAYGGQQTAPTTLDWILGVLWAVIAYWVSFLEEAQLGPRGRWFFIQDHSPVVFPILTLLMVFFVVGLVWSIILGLDRHSGWKGLNWHGFWFGPVWLFAFSWLCLGGVPVYS